MTTDPNSASHAEPAPDSAQPDRAARAGAGRSAPVEADYDREQVKQQALDLVAKIRRDTGRLQGSATTAARQLGLDPRTVRNWIRYVGPGRAHRYQGRRRAGRP